MPSLCDESYLRIHARPVSGEARALGLPSCYETGWGGALVVPDPVAHALLGYAEEFIKPVVARNRWSLAW